VVVVALVHYWALFTRTTATTNTRAGAFRGMRVALVCTTRTYDDIITTTITTAITFAASYPS
jgi:hypothetical protein